MMVTFHCSTISVAISLIGLLQFPEFDAQSPRKVGSEQILLWRDERLAVIRSDGKDFQWLTSPPRRGLTQEILPSCLRLSPNRRRIAFGIDDNQSAAPPHGGTVGAIHVRDLETGDETQDLKIDGHFWCWSPDSRKLAVTLIDDDPKLQVYRFKHWLVDVVTGVKSTLDIPADHAISDWSPDGKWFATSSNWGSFKEHVGSRVQLSLVSIDGSAVRPIGMAGRAGLGGRFSPDGLQLLSLQENNDSTGQLVVTSLANGECRQLTTALNGTIAGFCWSPDGQQIAYAWRQQHPQPLPNQETESFLVVVDCLGNNSTTILTDKSDNPATNHFWSIDWR